MRSRWLLLPLTVVVAVVYGGAAFGTSANVRVTRDATASSYLRYDGSSDATTAACSTGRRPQNEPTVAVNPHDASSSSPARTTTAPRSSTARSGPATTARPTAAQAGRTASSRAIRTTRRRPGLASPTHGTCGAAGDPSQAFDRDGRLFYAFICFNRSKPINGGVFVARYPGDGAATTGPCWSSAAPPPGSS